MYISASGKILPCMLLAGQSIEKKFPFYFQKSIKEVLQDSFYLEFITQNFQDFLDHDPSCQSCRYQRECLGGCRAEALKEDESALLKKDPKRCLFFLDG